MTSSDILRLVKVKFLTLLGVTQTSPWSFCSSLHGQFAEAAWRPFRSWLFSGSSRHFSTSNDAESGPSRPTGENVKPNFRFPFLLPLRSRSNGSVSVLRRNDPSDSAEVQALRRTARSVADGGESSSATTRTGRHHLPKSTMRLPRQADKDGPWIVFSRRNPTAILHHSGSFVFHVQEWLSVLLSAMQHADTNR